MTPASVFVDASAWLAFFNRRDAHHLEAREHMTRLLRSGTPLATSTWTTYEAITIARSKLGYGRARRIWRLVNDRRIIAMVRVDPTIEAAALKLFWRHRDKDWALSIARASPSWIASDAEQPSRTTTTSSRPASNAASRCSDEAGSRNLASLQHSVIGENRREGSKCSVLGPGPPCG